MNALRRSIKRGVLLAFISAAAPPAVFAGDQQVRWSPSDDLAHYRSLTIDTPGRGAVFPVFLTSALQSANYRAGTQAVSAAPCAAWIAVQVIEVQSTHAYTLFCKEAGAWNAQHGNAYEPTAQRSTFHPSSQEMNDLLSRAAKVEGVYDNVAFDAQCVYVTTYDGSAVVRLAVHAPEHVPSGTDGRARAAVALALDMEALSRRATGE